MTGKEKGKSSVVSSVIAAENKVVLEGLNIMKKHVKAKKAGEKGGIAEIAMPINASNVKLSEKATPKKKVAKK